ncbi:MAG TPA: hypothetical protein VM536_20100, partial [Chloroflexia bacterium]|nr:hypothetical protein [Chloroflexia bacterium]
REEDAAATALLGLDLVLLDYADAIYREGRYLSGPEIMTTLHPDEVALPGELAGVLRTLLRDRAMADAIIYAPLGLGRHVDHRITHAAARILEAQGRPVLYYEDYPYASKPEAHAARFADLGVVPADGNAAADRVAVPLYRDIGATIDRKIAAIAAYPSQISSLFPSLEAMPEAVRAYAAGVAADWRRDEPESLPAGPVPAYAERYWRLEGAT